MWRMSVITEMRILASSDAQIVIFNARNRSIRDSKQISKIVFKFHLDPKSGGNAPYFEILDISLNCNAFFCFLFQCSAFRKVESSERCEFIRSNDDCHLSDGFLQYIQFPYCYLPNLLPLAFILMVSIIYSPQSVVL